MAARVAVVVFPGTNCEHDVVAALERVGAAAALVWHTDAGLGRADAVVLPGGFAHGDYLRPGALARFSPVMGAVARFAAEGGPVIGICNGFQVLTEAGLLPGALVKNRGLRFVCAPCRVRVVSDRSVLTAGIATGTALSIPVNHFSGSYVCDPATLDRLRDGGQVVLRYAENPNGSVDDIAGVANAAGNVVGLMPHPERAIDALLGSSDGQVLLRALVGQATGVHAAFRVTASVAATVAVTAEEPLHRSLGLTDDELASVTRALGRPPNHLELALYAVMWSEHCSYKSSRLHLRRLPTEGDRVLVGPGENAGVVDAGDGIAVAIRIESHNHPSAIEPHQGAATGVGGILRDVFTMGARPLAVMDPLFFGPLDTARQRWLVEGVVGGISAYGNSVGVPTVGGELTFDPCYAGNPLVNVLCLGALPVDRLVLGAASGPGNLAVLLGSTTGRDGIGGVSVLASAGFGGDGEAADDAKRPSVQVGDPFEEKRLIEACLALLDAGLVVGIQDLGGAGLACATSETAARGGVGMDVDVSAVPCREPHMAPWEVMTSESQERMLAIVTPDDWPAVADLCRRWEVRATVVGTVTEPVAEDGGPAVGHLRVLAHAGGPVLADVPAASLADDAPLYDRPRAEPADRAARLADDPTTEPAGDCGTELRALLVDPSWVYRQYDHQLFCNTVAGPGGDAALLRLAGPGLPPSERGMAVTTDSAPRWCALDPRAGTAMLLAEAVLNLACVGARGTAVVNCLNFGNPEHPEVMWQLSEAIDGLADACRALGLPVIGGNVSLYNESAGADIDPTPVLGVLGLVESLRRPPPGIGIVDGSTIVVLGSRTASTGEPYPLGGSRWAVECRGRRSGRLPALDLDAHARLATLVATLVSESVAGGDGPVAAVHDVSGGGLAVALAEMAVAGGTGVGVHEIGGHAELFTELPSRVLVATRQPGALLARASAAGVPAVAVGAAGGDRVVVDGLDGPLVDLPVGELAASWKGALPALLEAEG